MIKIIALTFLFQLFLLIEIFSQDTINFRYFENLKYSLTEDTNIKEIKYTETKYSNGKIKFQGLFVKLKNDSNNRFWQVGKSFGYYKNGRLKGYNNVDLITKTQIDTSYWFDKEGKLKKLTIFSDCSTNKLLANRLLRNSYSYFPCKFTEMIYIGGNKWIERTLVFCDERGNLFIDGEQLFYKRDGSIDKREIYKCGRKIR